MKPPNRSRKLSGAVGGPGLEVGKSYERRYTLRLLLDLIAKVQSTAVDNWTVSIEGRMPSSGDVTRWDLRIEPGSGLTELKSNPSRQGILDWVARSARAETPLAPQKYIFVYSSNENARGLLKTISRLVEIAREARDDFEFGQFCAQERLEGVDEVLTLCRGNPHRLLSQMSLEQVLDASLDGDIEFRARSLAGSKATQLTDRLTTIVLDAAKVRGNLSVRKLIGQLTEQGIPLHTPVDTSSVSASRTTELVFILQNCEVGLPVTPLAEALRCSIHELESEISLLEQTDRVSRDGEIVRLSPGAAPVLSAPAEDLLARTLDALVDFLEAGPDVNTLRTQSHNVVVLCAVCLRSYPKQVALVFPRLDKRIKRLGNKQLVLQIADASVEGARLLGPSRTAQYTAAEVRSLICGVAWVRQRVGDLQAAREAITFALNQAAKLHSPADRAFGVKCLGRLCRMEAERLPVGADRWGKLDQSEQWLKESILRFSELEQYGPDHPEVGDAWSLLGRTYLVADRYLDATKAVRNAERLLFDPKNKDYWDLQILLGDLAVRARNDREEAEQYYRMVIDLDTAGDPEKSEMLARALLRSGKNSIQRGLEGLARKRFERAFEIWTQLGEVRAAADAKWELTILDKPPEEFLRAVGTRSNLVRVFAWERYREVRNRLPRGVALRDHTVALGQIVREAESAAASADIRW